MIIDAFAGNLLVLTGSVSINLKPQTVHQKIGLRQAYRSNKILLSVGNFLGLTDRPRLDRSITCVALSDTLHLSSDAEKSVYGDAHDLLFFWHKVEIAKYQKPTSLLTLTQSINVFKNSGVDSVLMLTDSWNYLLVSGQSVSDEIAFDSECAGYLPKKCKTAIPITLTPSDTIFTFGTTVIKLRSPEFGNSEKLSQNRIIRRSRAGDLIVFNASNWPSTDTLSMTFSYLDETTALRFVKFMNDTMGRKVTFNDWEGNVWLGYIMTPAAQAAEQFKNNFTITIEFQGTIQ